MNQRTAEAMAATVERELGSRARFIRAERHIEHGFPDPFIWWGVALVVDNYLHLGFAEPDQWGDLKVRYSL